MVCRSRVRIDDSPPPNRVSSWNDDDLPWLHSSGVEDDAPLCSFRDSRFAIEDFAESHWCGVEDDAPL